MKLKRAFVLLALFALLTGIISAENGGYQMPAELPLCQNDAILDTKPAKRIANQPCHPAIIK